MDKTNACIDTGGDLVDVDSDLTDLIGSFLKMHPIYFAGSILQEDSPAECGKISVCPFLKEVILLWCQTDINMFCFPY